MSNANLSLLLSGLTLVKANTGKVSIEQLHDSLQDDDITKVVHCLKTLQEEEPSLQSYVIRGMNFHQSHSDPSDKKEVLSVRLYSDKEGKKYVRSVHIHKDGSFQSNRSKD
ncbi:hypothetical protein F5890DRAFT_1531867 [Lentinula detonsa]|uniref:Uncharacterized protein n=1 Tax=Lentinula detonsa TaxID=2804962 RepID=A0AA38UQY7_9AGAR|nr:hypothetical protein F5890DRAFT_1531867 [Lentinula detonsa]